MSGGGVRFILAADVGSTFTKLTALDAGAARVIASAKAPTTTGSNILDGYLEAERELCALAGRRDYDARLASSSAAGGLNMVSVGLAPELSSAAARLAAENAGAKVTASFSHELSSAELARIEELSPDIILLSGGTDGGNRSVAEANARRIARARGSFSVVVACNKSAADGVLEILADAGREAVVCPNVMPSLGKLDIAPARAAISALFLKNIIRARGLEDLQAILAAPIVPTPLAVFNALTLLSRGTGELSGIGALTAFDIGGATTDAYSCAEGLPTRGNVVLRGLPEPADKRSVEADIGMRRSAPHLLERAGADAAARRAGCSPGAALAWAERCREDPGTLPSSGEERRMDAALAWCAADIAASRHCGSVESSYTPMGEVFLQTGKDLSGVEIVIGAGGVVAHAADPAAILRAALRSPARPSSLRPERARFLADRSGALAAAGLAARIAPEAALEIMKRELVEV